MADTVTIAIKTTTAALQTEGTIIPENEEVSKEWLIFEGDACNW